MTQRPTLEKTDILLINGTIEAVGTYLSFSKGTIAYDLTEKTGYQLFVYAHAANF